MSKVVEVTLPDAMYDAAKEQAIVEGTRTSRNPGVASVARKALRYYLNKKRVPVEFLDLTDRDYAVRKSVEKSGLPSTGNGNENGDNDVPPAA